MGKRRRPGAAAIIERLARDPFRGEVFWWLYDEYEAIQERTLGQRISWKMLLADLQRLNLKNAVGDPIDKVRTLQGAFRAVGKLKAREAEIRLQRAAARKRPTNDPPPLASEAPDV